MTHPLVRKLQNFTMLPPDELRAVLEAMSNVRAIAAREDIVVQGEQNPSVKVLLEGFACRYKMLEDGRRQILSLFVPGDMCDLRVFILKRMDHCVSTLTPARFAILSPESILRLTHRYSTLTRALWWTTLVEEAIAREWIVNVGQRTALERTAHLFCELYFRLRAVDLTRGLTFPVPLTQIELSEALGLSSVHVNRTLQELRRQNLIKLDAGILTILDLEALTEVAFFNPDYLHLEQDSTVAMGDVREATEYS
jgi:CRP-like cAMP-binding protein